MPPRRIVDFTSALYLGLRHPPRLLKPWPALTTGTPAASGELPEAGRLAAKFAVLIGCESAVLVSSTHHAFGDLFQMLTCEDTSIYTDAALYPVARWGVDRAACAGAASRPFGHHDGARLAARIRRRRSGQAIVVTDGMCPDCGTPAPMAEYVETLARCGGLVVIDDTQSLGLLGRSACAEAPYGYGGGGVLAWSGVRSRNVIVVASLAKAFGVPMAIVAGSRAMISRFKRRSGARVHCSQPSAANLHAAVHAFAVNQRIGDELRRTLARRVAEFREGLRAHGLDAVGGPFPVQTLIKTVSHGARRIREDLLRSGVRALLRRTHDSTIPRISFAINATHSAGDIQCAVNALAGCGAPLRGRTTAISLAGD